MLDAAMGSSVYKLQLISLTTAWLNHDDVHRLNHTSRGGVYNFIIASVPGLLALNLRR